MRNRAILVSYGIILSMCSCGDLQVEVPEALTAQILPQHGSGLIRTDVEGLVFFNHPVADAATAADHIELRCLGTPPCSSAEASGCTSIIPDATIGFDAAGQVARIAPRLDLQSNTCFSISVREGIQAGSEAVTPLAATLRSSFVTF